MPKPPPRDRRLIASALIVLALVTLAATGSTGTPAGSLLPAGALAPTPSNARWRRESLAFSRTIIIGTFRSMSTCHGKSSSATLNAIDGQTTATLLAGDVAGFERWRLKFGDMIHSGDLDPAYLMFNVLLQRNRDRINYAIKLLATEPDRKVDEKLHLRPRTCRMAGVHCRTG